MVTGGNPPGPKGALVRSCLFGRLGRRIPTPSRFPPLRLTYAAFCTSSSSLILAPFPPPTVDSQPARHLTDYPFHCPTKSRVDGLRKPSVFSGKLYASIYHLPLELDTGHDVLFHLLKSSKVALLCSFNFIPNGVGPECAEQTAKVLRHPTGDMGCDPQLDPSKSHAGSGPAVHLRLLRLSVRSTCLGSFRLF
ncbi:hypothetical protein BJX63DRAFT_341964 [Aspergillus granulosus]|uniref:Uncharacterized protein n=1 Tax=Aspergillus granulosus TaxID=176169 RepID=A0ABR4H2W2_9EURO